MRRPLLLPAFVCLVACGAPAPPAWPASLPAEATLEASEPRVLDDRATPSAVPGAERPEGSRDRADTLYPEDASPPPAGPETHAGDGDLVEVVQAEFRGIRYLEMVFGEADVGTALPTIWILHGLGDRARIPGGPFWGLPRAVRIFVPQGPVEVGDGFAWFPQRASDNRPDELAAALSASAAHLADMIRVFTVHRATLGRPIVTGFSQGGHMTYALALLHPEVARYAFPGAGWMPPSLVPDLSEPARFPSIRAQHTADDDRVVLPPTAALVDRLIQAGLDVELAVTPEGGHAMTPSMDTRLRAWLEEAIGVPPAPPAQRNAQEEPGALHEMGALHETAATPPEPRDEQGAPEDS